MIDLGIELARRELELSGKVPRCAQHEHEYKRFRKDLKEHYICNKHHYRHKDACHCGRNRYDPKPPRLSDARLWQLRRIVGR